MATFEDDCSGRSQSRSWDHEHRTAPRRQEQPRRTESPREPYLRIDNRKLFRLDLEEMDAHELDDIASRLEADNESIEQDLPALSGNAEIKAKDKKRFNEQWIRTIRDELIDEDFGDDEDEDDEDDEDEIKMPLADCLDTSEERRGPDEEERKSCCASGADFAKRLMESIGKHLSSRLAAIVIADATNETD